MPLIAANSQGEQSDAVLLSRWVISGLVAGFLRLLCLRLTCPTLFIIEVFLYFAGTVIEATRNTWTSNVAYNCVPNVNMATATLYIYTEIQTCCQIKTGEPWNLMRDPL